MTTSSEPAAALSAQGLSKRFDALEAVTDLSFEVRRGEVFGLIGPDGAGKTTTLRMVCGLVEPSAGVVRLLGEPLTGKIRRLRARIGYMPQQYSLYGDLSVQENLRFFAGMYGVPRRLIRERETRLLSIALLEPFRDRPAQALSGGMYKKLALACILMHQPELLLLDEPTNGVDPISRRELWAFLYELVGEGMSVLLSTPYMDEAERCNRVGVLQKGRLTALGVPRRLKEEFPHKVLELECAPFLDPDLLRPLAPSAAQIYLLGRRVRIVTPDPERTRRELLDGVPKAGSAVQRLVPGEATFEDVLFHLSQTPEGREPPS